MNDEDRKMNNQMFIKSMQNLQFSAEKGETKNIVLRVKNVENSQLEIEANENSQFTIYLIFEGKSAIKTKCNLQKNASITIFHLSKNAKFSQNSIETKLTGENANFELYGLIFGAENQQHKFQSKIVHAVPQCTSREIVKTILHDKSQCVFDGLILVEQDAQKTDSQMTNRNLLLSDNAKIETTPKLEIYADDVKCSHGATSGQLDSEALFYFRSRGISAKDALELLISGFAGEILEKIKDETVKKMMNGKI